MPYLLQYRRRRQVSKSAAALNDHENVFFKVPMPENVTANERECTLMKMRFSKPWKIEGLNRQLLIDNRQLFIAGGWVVSRITHFF